MLSDLQLPTKRWRHLFCMKVCNFRASFCNSDYLVIFFQNVLRKISPEKALQRPSILHLFFYCFEKHRQTKENAGFVDANSKLKKRT